MIKQIKISLVVILLFTILTGVCYPLAVTGIAQLLFPRQANGSMLHSRGVLVGSALIGQQFTSHKYFWSRISATVPYAYNAGASGGSNFGPLNPALMDEAGKRIHDLRQADSGNGARVPADLATSSASGLDPHISIASALFQVRRVARARGISEDSLRQIVALFTEGRQFGILGEPTVNVLKLNLSLDRVFIDEEGR